MRKAMATGMATATETGMETATEMATGMEMGTATATETARSCPAADTSRVPVVSTSTETACAVRRKTVPSVTRRWREGTS
jgi:hypothetical protein